jgi:hypothetical protein
MKQDYDDIAHQMTLDGNAVGGMLYDVFSAEMTASPTECAHCGRDSQIAQLLAFTQAPGLVLRCPGCGNPMVRIVRTEQYTYLDARGAVYLRIARQQAAH